MRKSFMKIAIAACLALLPSVMPAKAQQSALQYRAIVSSCSTITLVAGTARAMYLDVNGNPCENAPPGETAPAVTPVVSGSAESCHVLKASAGNLLAAYVVNLTGTGGFFILLNATSKPGDGAVTPLDVAILPANGQASIAASPGNLEVFSTGITACITSASTPFTLTSGTATGFIHGAVQ